MGIDVPYRYNSIVSHINRKFNWKFRKISGKPRFQPREVLGYWLIKSRDFPVFQLAYVNFLQRGKHEFLDQSVSRYVDRHSAVLCSFPAQFNVVPFQSLSHIALRVFTFHLFKKYIPHLIVAAQVFNFMNHLKFCHLKSFLSPLYNIFLPWCIRLWRISKFPNLLFRFHAVVHSSMFFPDFGFCLVGRIRISRTSADAPLFCSYCITGFIYLKVPRQKTLEICKGNWYNLEYMQG